MTFEASDPQALPAELKVERAETGRRRRLLQQARSAGGLLLAVGLVWLILFITTDGVFVSDRNLINLMRQTSVTAMVALGMLVIIAQGEIDLSVGSFLSLCATVIALMESWAALPAPVTILAALVLGVIVGLWNGLWVARLGVPAFVTTLGGMLAFRGISLAISGGNTISGIRGDIRFFGEAFITGPALWLFLTGAMLVSIAPLRRVEARQRPKELIKVAAGLLAVAALAWMTLSYRGLPMPVALTLVVGGALAYALKNLVWGRHAFAVGGNRTAAKIAGIAVGRQIVLSYVLIGVLTAIASLMFVGRLGAAPPEAGYFLELNAISAVVIGGASLYGGTGTVTGVLLGALLMQSLSNGLSLMNVPSAYQNITSGLVLMFAVYLDAVAKRGGVPFLRQ